MNGPAYVRTVLFVCEYNSARSQLAEAIAKRYAIPGLRILSAGLKKTIVNEDVLQSLAEIGIDASQQFSKSLQDVSTEPVDHIIVLAEAALDATRQVFPQAQVHYWPMSDPIRSSDDPAKIRDAVRRGRDILDKRVRHWLSIGRYIADDAA
jgi:arsenate reductase